MVVLLCFLDLGLELGNVCVPGDNDVFHLADHLVLLGPHVLHLPLQADDQRACLCKLVSVLRKRILQHPNLGLGRKTVRLREASLCGCCLHPSSHPSHLLHTLHTLHALHTLVRHFFLHLQQQVLCQLSCLSCILGLPPKFLVVSLIQHKHTLAHSHTRTLGGDRERTSFSEISDHPPHNEAIRNGERSESDGLAGAGATLSAANVLSRFLTR